MISTWLKRWAALAALTAVAACGGGGSDPAGPSAAGPTAVSMGTVTGFGSVIVDGVTYDDRAATVSLDTEDGAPDSGTNTFQIKLGQRVIMITTGSDSNGKVVSIQVSAEVVGRVTAVSPDLVIAGQTIKVNTDPAAGPVTVFEGFGSAADIQVGNRAEVHGSPTTVNGQVVIQATRIERKPSAEAWVRLAGVVSDLAADGSSFRIGGLTVNVTGSTRVVPRNATLANGRRVVVWSTGAQVGSAINASLIRLRVGEQQGLEEFRVAGPVSGCVAPCAGSFKVGGVQVNASSAQFVNGSAADLADGKYVEVRGQLNDAGTELVATRVVIRLRSSLPEVKLTGVITDYVDAQNFKVRGVPVTTDASTVLDNDCPSPLANGVLVEVEGRINQFRVLAKEIECRTAGDGALVEAKGVVFAHDPAAKTFRLPGSLFTGLTLQYSDNTVFEDGTAADFGNGDLVEIKGRISGTTVVVTKIEFERIYENVPPSLQVLETEGIASAVTRSGSLVTGLTVNGLTIAVNGQTVLVPNAAAIVDGAQVKVLFRQDPTTGVKTAVVVAAMP